MGVMPYNSVAALALYNRPQTVMFYETLRVAGGSTLVHPDTQPPDESVPVYETAILEEGKIAYLAVNRMIHLWDDPRPRRTIGQYEAMLHDFHGQIEGYDHLIIDLRGNSGGQNIHFFVFVVGPLLHEAIFFPVYVFYKDGEYSRSARENYDWRIFGSTHPFTQDAASFDGSLPYLDPEITLPYAFYSAHMISSSYDYSGWYDSIRAEVLFDGTIWMLVDEHTASAAEASAAMLKLNNLATIVGEATFGILGTLEDSTNALVSLPNTGIIVRMDIAYFTDTYGRPLQGYGITPHYFNRPGMDALETVLAMIAETDEGGS